ncbi:response regulator [Paludifilum halophilum]|uniref:Transcriptional regulatory protein n=1 Tax=Paludifilum halophilum TaxID=1642702 RepID=A0A235B533_9BACL|nr:response regulator [Paludifilum halophilum]OYD07341.1 hypothetical protein CHM34_10525 [Paludifilum halophilum]
MIRVLIVEDDPMVAAINQSYLDSMPGFSCTEIATKASDALDFLGRNSVDLVLLDIFMPGKSGLDLLREIRTGKKGIDVIVITAASDIHNIKTALRLGAVDYLIKPFTFDRLQASLERYKQEHKMMQEQKRWNQDELDRLLRTREGTVTANPPELPKGLTLITLRRVVNSILKMDEEFSTEELAHEAGISRVSARKYLNFLVDIGHLWVNMVYKTVGRPVYQFHLTKEHRERIQPYLEAPDP